MTLENTIALLELITAAYPRFEIVKGEETFSVWHECLEDLDYEDAKTATKNVIRESEFPPTIAEIRKAYSEIEDERKKIRSLIRQEYDAIRSYYPSCGELNNGWPEFQERCDSPEKAKKLRTALYNYVREVEQTGGNTEPFVEKIKTIPF